MPLGVQLHFWGEALPGPLLQTPGDCAVHPVACSLGTFARFLQDMQAVQVSPSFKSFHLLDGPYQSSAWSKT